MLKVDTEVQEIQGCLPARLPEEVLLSTQPLVMRGLVADWPMVRAAAKSSDHVLDYLGKFDSGRPLTAMLGSPDIDGRIFYNDDLTGFNFDYARIGLQEVFARLRESQSTTKPPMVYVGSTNIDNWLPGFRNENDLGLDDYSPMASIWIGNRSRVAAHYDFPTNIACSVAGRRRVTLFPPDQLNNLYVGPIDMNPAGQPISLVDFSNPDYEQFPRFKEALKVAQTVELEPGDAILIPSMWWHHVESLGEVNVLVNYWWRSTPYFLGGPLNVLQHAMLGLKDLPPEQRDVWREIFNHYVFNPSEENMAHIPKEARGVLNKIDETTAAKIRTLLMSKLKH
ncbi:MAG: hypothetical protein ACI89A_000550 [Porticoccaceae bacterium]|jgi:hypothetical protein